MIYALSTYQNTSLFAAFKAQPAATADNAVKVPAEKSARGDASFFSEKLANRVQDTIFGAADAFSNRDSRYEKYGSGSSEYSREISVSRGDDEIASLDTFAKYAYDYEIKSDSVKVSFSQFSSLELEVGDREYEAEAGLELEIEIKSDGSFSFSFSGFVKEEKELDDFGYYESETKVSFNLDILADGTVIQEQKYEDSSKGGLSFGSSSVEFYESEKIETTFVSASANGESSVDAVEDDYSTVQLQTGFDPEIQTVVDRLQSVLEKIDEAGAKVDKKEPEKEFSLFSATSTFSTASVVLAYQEF